MAAILVHATAYRAESSCYYKIESCRISLESRHSTHQSELPVVPMTLSLALIRLFQWSLVGAM